MDRRIKKSKTVLKNTFFQLLKRKNINDISVTELCEKADINRSTFYYHYKYIEDFICEIYHDELIDIEKRLNLTMFFDTKDENDESLILLLKELENTDNHLHLLLSRCNKNDFVNWNFLFWKNKKESSELTSVNKYKWMFGYAGILQILYQWINEKCKDCPETIAAIIYDLTVKIWC